MKKLLMLLCAGCWFASALCAREMTTVVQTKPGRPPVKESFTFVVWGDNQPRSPHGPQPMIFKRIVAEVKRLLPDFVVSLGDAIYGSASDEKLVREQYREYQSVLKKLSLPVYHVPGNHETGGTAANRRLYEEFFGKRNYSFTHKGCLFFLLDTEAGPRGGCVEESVFPRLRDELAAGSTSSFTFLFLHRPLFPAVRLRFHEMDEGCVKRLVPLVREGGTDIVFAGHEHLYRTERTEGLLQITSGGAGASLLPTEEGNFHHYLLVTVSGDTVTVEVKIP